MGGNLNGERQTAGTLRHGEVRTIGYVQDRNRGGNASASTDRVGREGMRKEGAYYVDAPDVDVAPAYPAYESLNVEHSRRRHPDNIFCCQPGQVHDELPDARDNSGSGGDAAACMQSFT